MLDDGRGGAKVGQLAEQRDPGPVRVEAHRQHDAVATGLQGLSRVEDHRVTHLDVEAARSADDVENRRVQPLDQQPQRARRRLLDHRRGCRDHASMVTPIAPNGPCRVMAQRAIVPLESERSMDGCSVETEKVCVNLPAAELGKIDVLVAEGLYASRTDVIRNGIRLVIDAHPEPVQRLVPDARVGYQLLMKSELETALRANTRLSLFVVGVLRIQGTVTPELADADHRTHPHLRRRARPRQRPSTDRRPHHPRRRQPGAVT